MGYLIPRCVHCTAEVIYGEDPAPDMCAGCDQRGRTSPMWSRLDSRNLAALRERLAADAARRQSSGEE